MTALPFRCLTESEVNTCLDHRGDVNLRTYRDLLRSHLAISIAFSANLVKFHFVEDRSCWIVICEAVYRVFTCVETAITKTCLIFGVCLALFVLESPASHIGFESFVCFHLYNSLNSSGITTLLFQLTFITSDLMSSMLNPAIPQPMRVRRNSLSGITLA